MTTKQSNLQETTASPSARPKHPYHQVLKWVADGEEIQGLTESNENDGWYDLEHNDVLAHCTGFGDKLYFQPNEFRIKPKPHIHQELMDAHKAGAIIQWQSGGCWFDCSLNSPVWVVSAKYRIKPQPKPDIIGYCNVDYAKSSVCYPINFGNVTVKLLPTDNVKVTFCGETLKLKAIEMVRGNNNDTI